ncbi:MAG: UDP-3-O-(3-hydroxymyristoyl)glucosamine N-acyltransferase [Candidatus Puniceispirillum sp.]|nr:UDP-3-O-(3-hydroxymyristoyl)glucosamine N-acyltransferase [Candidatus Pelagibacter sp.]MBA4282762.1 UDP-3-O-(3-hydroxymyristoyl)glucosamine N-acyltransferase [Candidatus Puniceispirillum sp.]
MINNKFYPNFKPISFSQIIEIAQISSNDIYEELDPGTVFTGISKIDQAMATDIAVFHNNKYAQEAKVSKAGLTITTEELSKHLPASAPFIAVSNPYRIFAKIIAFMNTENRNDHTSIHPTSIIDPTAKMGNNCIIGPHVVIDAFAEIGDNSKIASGTYIGPSVIVGNNATIHSSVTLSHCEIGDNVIIKPGAKIGQSGFGFNMDDQGPFDVPHVGIVQIGHNVQIGANTCIDRGSIGNTVIQNGVRIDNLVQIAHNVVIGENSIIVAQVGIAGSTHLGKFVVAAGQVGISGHLKIGNFVKIAAQSGIIKDIDDNMTVGGSPAVSVHDWHRQTIALKNLIKKKI